MELAIGDALLLGWRMLSEVCPMDGCLAPIMQKPQSAEIWCLRCRARIVHETEHRQQQDRELHKERVYKLLGDKMLQGWTLLAQYCDTCNNVPVPLMRNKRKEDVCVWCLEQQQEGREEQEGEGGGGQGTCKEETVEEHDPETETETETETVTVREALKRKCKQYAIMLDHTKPQEFKQVEDIYQAIEKTYDLMQKIKMHEDSSQ
jgi:uncharacterized Zn finger protein (UPF0148 family)